jgi:hypothetical protein
LARWSTRCIDEGAQLSRKRGTSRKASKQTVLRGKGDHRHIEDRQERYVFKTVELLMADFLADVRRLRGE